MGRVHVGSALALLAVAAAACGKQAPPAPMGRPPSLVVTATATSKDVQSYVDEIATCIASESVTIVPQVSGTVTRVDVKDGADLKVGDALFTIDERPYKARLDEAKARAAAASSAVELARAAKGTAEARVATAASKREEMRASETSARADLTRAAEDAKRMESMADSGAISAQELTKARTEAAGAQAKLAQAAATLQSADNVVKEAESQLAEAEARVKSATADEASAAAAVEPARLDLEYCTIVSPIVGRASRRLQDVGNVVVARTTPLLSIQRTDPLDVEFAITEAELSGVQRTLTAKKSLKAEVRLPDAPPGSEARAGDVVFLDNAVSGTTGTVRLRARVENGDARFWPGRFVRVRLLLDPLPQAVLVPANAPQVSQMGPFVYVVAAGEKGPVAELRPVQLGQRQGDQIVITSGLKAGEKIVVEGQVGTYPGAALAEMPPAPAAAGGGTGGAPGQPTGGGAAMDSKP